MVDVVVGLEEGEKGSVLFIGSSCDLLKTLPRLLAMVVLFNPMRP